MDAYIDIEAALADKFGPGTSAPPLPEGFSLPFALFTRVGGDTSDRVYTAHDVSVDVYADTWAQAQASAAEMAGLIADLDGRNVGYSSNGSRIEAPVYVSACQAPYNNPDPKHPNVPRVTFMANLATRTIRL